MPGARSQRVMGERKESVPFEKERKKCFLELKKKKKKLDPAAVDSVSFCFTPSLFRARVPSPSLSLVLPHRPSPFHIIIQSSRNARAFSRKKKLVYKRNHPLLSKLCFSLSFFLSLFLRFLSFPLVFRTHKKKKTPSHFLRRRSSAASTAAERRAVGTGRDLLVAAAATAAKRRAVSAVAAAVPSASNAPPPPVGSPIQLAEARLLPAADPQTSTPPPGATPSPPPPAPASASRVSSSARADAAPPTSAPTSALSTAPTGRIQVQYLSTTSEAELQQATDKLREKLGAEAGRLSFSTAHAVVRGVSRFRGRIGPFASGREATAFCVTVKRSGFSCLPVPDGGGR